jgi:hypothetical protein
VKASTLINEEETSDNNSIEILKKEEASERRRRKPMSAMIANDALSISVKANILLRSEMSVISVAEDHGLPLCKILGNLMMNPSYLLTTLTAANVQMFLSALTFYAPGYAL